MYNIRMVVTMLYVHNFKFVFQISKYTYLIGVDDLCKKLTETKITAADNKIKVLETLRVTEGMQVILLFVIYIRR